MSTGLRWTDAGELPNPAAGGEFELSSPSLQLVAAGLSLVSDHNFVDSALWHCVACSCRAATTFPTCRKGERKERAKRFTAGPSASSLYITIYLSRSRRKG